MTRDAPLLRWQVLFAPKRGHTEEEYEDAWAADPWRRRFAVADGASETSFAGRWAQLLTEGYLGAARPSAVAEWLPAARRQWAAEVMGLELPWYAEMKREQGAFATFLGVRLRRPSAGRPAKWRAVAVGDSCLIRVRRNGHIRSFPLHESTDFGNQPRLIGSRGGAAVEPATATGTLPPGDRLLLVTDALAQWFLQSHERGGRPAEAVAEVLTAERPDEAFAVWIEERRDRDGLRNDDVTLLTVEIGFMPEE